MCNLENVYGLAFLIVFSGHCVTKGAFMFNMCNHCAQLLCIFISQAFTCTIPRVYNMLLLQRENNSVKEAGAPLQRFYCCITLTTVEEKCWLMFPSSIFRGKGPLKNTSDVIKAAKKIAEAGTKMDKLGRSIADLVSENKPIKARGWCKLHLCATNPCKLLQ